ncbi:hypothetical protein niasHT_016342 [Heterodera trifolii]|uniref:G-protein coupled receptors family 1 profile domain-containing protein n=1 Tax=Heterodera trifolii TaxID=157864 RepID=A0ABD2KZ11_9BILA
MTYNASADLWFQYFTSDGPQCFILFAVYGARFLWTTLGLLFNFGVVYITAKSKTLRGTCNILIAMESAFALILDLGFYVSFFVLLSGRIFVRYEYCFWALLLPAVFGDMAQLTMVLTGVDRLCCVMFPIWYKKRNAKCYLAFVWTILCCYATYQFIIDYIDYQNSKDFMVSCSTNEMGNGGMGSLMRVNGLTLSGTLMAVYSLCWFIVFRMSAVSKNVNSDNRKLIKSLVFIISLNLSCVFIKCGVNLLLQFVFQVNVFIKSAFSIAFSFLTITVYSANAPVLFVVSNLYRNHFIRHFPWLSKLVRSNDKVSSICTSTTTVIVQPKNGIVNGANGFYNEKLASD